MDMHNGLLKLEFLFWQMGHLTMEIAALEFLKIYVSIFAQLL